MAHLNAASSHSASRHQQPCMHAALAPAHKATFHAAHVQSARRRHAAPLRAAPPHAPQAASQVKSRSGASTLIKICGVTRPEDAAVAVEAGADLIGMIMWPKAKRSVSDDTAARIVRVAHEAGARAVGVFVDEDPHTIVARCRATGLQVAQLHGDGARSSFPALRAPSSTSSSVAPLQLVYVLHSTPGGEVVTALPPTTCSPPDWLLVDGMQGGSGQTLDWSRLAAPHPGACAAGWLLAGGLHPDNVGRAVSVARPTAVDVSSGVCGPDGLKKDAGRIRAFIEAVKGAGR